MPNVKPKPILSEEEVLAIRYKLIGLPYKITISGEKLSELIDYVNCVIVVEPTRFYQLKSINIDYTSVKIEAVLTWEPITIDKIVGLKDNTHFYSAVTIYRTYSIQKFKNDLGIQNDET